TAASAPRTLPIECGAAKRWPASQSVIARRLPPSSGATIYAAFHVCGPGRVWSFPLGERDTHEFGRRAAAVRRAAADAKFPNATSITLVERLKTIGGTGD